MVWSGELTLELIPLMEREPAITARAMPTDRQRLMSDLERYGSHL